jgi:flagellar L-ring protein precursor FlgH
MKTLVFPLACCFLTACAVVERPRVEVMQPTSIKPSVTAPVLESNGAIFQVASGTYRPLFEDRRARYVGDILTIQINEKTQATSKQSTNAEKTSSLNASSPEINVLNRRIRAVDLETSSTAKSDGKGQAAADNLFTGTITVTVIEVLANGNLAVSGEKQVGIGQNMEVLRFSGIVNPSTILNGNSVSSTQVADARLETRGRGAIDQAQTTGWLTRFFMSYWPF